ncbi:TPA: HNH endonuclease [Bacillus cereus]|nr:HNH endonuclease [Bacillus cereus]
MENYKLAAKPFIYDFTHQDEGKKVTFGEKSSRKCMYCGKIRGETTFKKDAHVIPAGLGNRILFNYNECDNCNEHYFGDYENELANFLMLDRIFIGAKKRRGMPKYKPNRKGNTSIEHLDNNNTVHIQIGDLEDKFEITHDTENNTVTYRINTPLKYRPADICKALTHMVWPFLSDEKREQLKHIPSWLLGDEDIFPLYLDSVFVPGNGFAKGILEFWESTNKDSLYPVMVRFTFGLKIISFYIPSSIQTQVPPTRNQDYIFIPENAGELMVDAITINNNEHLQPTHLTYTFRFQSIEEKKNDK